MAQPTLEEIIKQGEELIRIYEEVTQTEIPRSVQAARKEKWQLLPKGIAVAGLVRYAQDEIRVDGTRVISLPVALQIIEDFEDGLLSKTVKNPKQIFVSKVRNLVGIVRGTATALPLLWDVVKELISVWDILDLLAYLARLGFITDLFDPNSRLRAFAEAVFELCTRYLVFLLSAMLSAFAVPLFSATVVAVEKEREFWVARMRRAALPQRNQRRVWRRKVSRL